MLKTIMASPPLRSLSRTEKARHTLERPAAQQDELADCQLAGATGSLDRRPEMNFSRELKHVSPLCSPRKTSLNFLKGFPKSLPTDILRRRRRKRRRGNSGHRRSVTCVAPVRVRCWLAEMLDGKGGDVVPLPPSLSLSAAPVRDAREAPPPSATRQFCACAASPRSPLNRSS